MSGKQNCFLLQAKTFFVFRAAKFVSATYVYRAAKLGNICISNNVSYFSQALTSIINNSVFIVCIALSCDGVLMERSAA